MKSDNPHSGFYEAGTSRTLDGNGGNPSCNQGGIAVVEGNGSRPSHQGDGYKESDVMYTLNATEQHGVAYGIDRATYNMGQNAQFDIAIREEVEPTIVAKGPGAVAHPVYSTSKNSYHTEAEENLANTLVATDYKDPAASREESALERISLFSAPSSQAPCFSQRNSTASATARAPFGFSPFCKSISPHKPITEWDVLSDNLSLSCAFYPAPVPP